VIDVTDGALGRRADGLPQGAAQQVPMAIIPILIEILGVQSLYARRSMMPMMTTT
jgi:hypothetical protein